VEPVEINAGAWYLRAPRQDELIDDRPALADLGETDPDYVTRCSALWSSDTGYTWAVCEPTTGEMLDNDLNFIQTMINVVVVALENKKLFRDRLQTERFRREMELAAEVQNMLIPLGKHKDESVEIGAKCPWR